MNKFRNSFSQKPLNRKTPRPSIIQSSPHNSSPHGDSPLLSMFGRLGAKHGQLYYFSGLCRLHVPFGIRTHLGHCCLYPRHSASFSRQSIPLTSIDCTRFGAPKNINFQINKSNFSIRKTPSRFPFCTPHRNARSSPVSNQANSTQSLFTLNKHTLSSVPPLASSIICLLFAPLHIQAAANSTFANSLLPLLPTPNSTSLVFLFCPNSNSFLVVYLCSTTHC